MIRQTLEKTFSAAAFAEAGEHETAMKWAGIQPVYEKVRKVVDSIERCFAAVGFAEAGWSEEAIKMANPNPVSVNRRETLDNFLENVGLGNVRVCYGLATV